MATCVYTRATTQAGITSNSKGHLALGAATPIAAATLGLANTRNSALREWQPQMQTRCSLAERMTSCPVCACLVSGCPPGSEYFSSSSRLVPTPFGVHNRMLLQGRVPVLRRHSSRRRLDARLMVRRWQCCASRSCRSLACTAAARSTPHLRHRGGAAGTGALSSTRAVFHFTPHSKCSSRKDTCSKRFWSGTLLMQPACASCGSLCWLALAINIWFAAAVQPAPQPHCPLPLAAPATSAIPDY